MSSPSNLSHRVQFLSHYWTTLANRKTTHFDGQRQMRILGIGFSAPAWRAVATNSKRVGQGAKGVSRLAVSVIVLGIGGLTAVAALAIHAQPKLPAPAGPFPVGVVDGDLDSPEEATLTSDARSCGITTRLWFPAEPGTGRGRAPYDTGKTSLLSAERWITTSAVLDAQVATVEPRYPVLLFFPGWDGKRATYAAIVQDLASRGFVVAAIGYDSEDCARPDQGAPRRVRLTWTFPQPPLSSGPCKSPTRKSRASHPVQREYSTRWRTSIAAIAEGVSPGAWT